MGLSTFCKHTSRPQSITRNTLETLSKVRTGKYERHVQKLLFGTRSSFFLSDLEEETDNDEIDDDDGEDIDDEILDFNPDHQLEDEDAKPILGLKTALWGGLKLFRKLVRRKGSRKGFWFLG